MEGYIGTVIFWTGLLIGMAYVGYKESKK